MNVDYDIHGVLSLRLIDPTPSLARLVARQLDPWRAVSTECGPQTEDDSTRLEEGDLIVGLPGAGPAERLIERASAAKVPDPERHETDALFHAPSMAR